MAESVLLDLNMQLDDEESWSFDAARDLDRDDEPSDCYARHIVDRSSKIGVLFTTCEDVAHAFRSVDYDETGPALRATLRQWHATADSLNPASTLAVRLRATAILLEQVLDDDELDEEYVTDLISLANMHDELLELAAGKRMHDGQGKDPEAWWADLGDQLYRLHMVRIQMLNDLADNRGEDVPQEWRP